MDFSSMWSVFYDQMFTYNGYKKVLDGLLATAEIAVFGLLDRHSHRHAAGYSQGCA